jgi:hypothetical protein
MQLGRRRLRAGLAAGDPAGEVAAAWQGTELLRAVYAAGGQAAARAALNRFYRWWDGVGVAELSRLARTVRSGRPRSSPGMHRRLLQRAHRGCQPADQEGQAGRHGFRNFANYRLLLHWGVTWQTHRTTRLRGRFPRLVA